MGLTLGLSLAAEFPGLYNPKNLEGSLMFKTEAMGSVACRDAKPLKPGSWWRRGSRVVFLRVSTCKARNRARGLLCAHWAVWAVAFCRDRKARRLLFLPDRCAPKGITAICLLSQLLHFRSRRGVRGPSIFFGSAFFVGVEHISIGLQAIERERDVDALWR
jgi:hypothetical protein